MQQPENSVERPIGIQQAIVSDVYDIGDLDDIFHPGKKVHKIAITWQLKEKFTDGKPYIQTELFTLSLHEKSKLRKFIEGMTGRTLMIPVGKSLDVETLRGVNCMVSIKPKPSKDGDKVYMQIADCTPLMKGLEKMVIDETMKTPDWVVALRAQVVGDVSSKMDIDDVLANL
jgi:hypothetical protein